MSKKAKARKRKYIWKIADKAFNYVLKMVELRTEILRQRGEKIPQLEKGGRMSHSDIYDFLHHEKVQPEINKPHCIVYDGSKDDPEYLTKMSHLLNSSKTVMNISLSEFNPHFNNGWK